MEREKVGLDFWNGFEKRAGMLSDIGTRMANGAAKYTAKFNSPKEKLLRIAGGTMLAGGGLAYGASKINQDPEAKGVQRV